MEDSIVLEEDIDPNYVPSEEEFREYAESLGLEIPEDNDLLYLAREGLKARLPKEWKPCQTRDEQIFYFNFETGESVWEHPCDTYYRKKVKEAKDAKKLRQDKSKIKPLQQSKKTNNLAFSPVQEQPENSELSRRKKELEEDFLKYSEQLKKEYTEKKNEQKRTVDKELEDMKEKFKKSTAEKEETASKSLRQKIDQARSNLKRQFDKEENDKIQELSKQLSLKLDEINSEYFKRLEEEKMKSTQRRLTETEDEIKRIKKLNETEIEDMRNELKYLKEKFEDESNEKDSMKMLLAKKLSALKERIQTEAKSERRAIEKETERQMKNLRQEENGEISVEDSTLLYNLEKELSSNLNKELMAIRLENAAKISKEKEKIIELAKAKAEKLRIDNEMLIENELLSKESELKLKLSEALAEYRLTKDKELSQDLKDLDQHLERILDSEEQQAIPRQRSLSVREEERKSDSDNKLRNLQRELANLEHHLYVKNAELKSLSEEEVRLKSEIQRIELESVDFKSQDYLMENMVIADLEQQIIEKQNEIRKFSEPNPEKFRHFEKEVTSLKQLLLNQKSPEMNRDEYERMRQALAAEKEELKQIQNVLKSDREKWNREMKDYKANPSDRKRVELYNVKRIIEKNIQKHNARVKELKQAEELMRNNGIQGEGSEDEELVLEMWRNAEKRPSNPTQHARQPWQNHNLHVYQRQVNKWCKSREYMKDVMTRHGSWLNNMKEQLNRVMSTPHTIKSFH